MTYLSFIRSLSCSFSCQFNLIMHKRQVLMHIKPNNLQIWICLPIQCENFHWFVKWVGNYYFRSVLVFFSFILTLAMLWYTIKEVWGFSNLSSHTDLFFIRLPSLWFPEVTAHTSLICQKSRKFNHTKSLHWIPIQEE